MLTSGLYGKELSSSFNSAITAPAQKIKPKVIIKWLDSRHLDNLVVTTNDAPATNSYPSRGFFFPASEAFNGIRRQSFTWAVAGATDTVGNVIKADGSWYAMPSLTTNDLSNTQMGSGLEFGWWSNSVSNANTHATYDGYGFVTDPYIQATFTTRKVNKIRIVTSEFYGQISTYLLQAYDGSLNLVLNEIGTIPSDGYYRDHILSAALSTNNISKIKVTVYTTKNPEDYARIQEVVPIYEEDISDYVISYSVNRVRDAHSTSLPIGGSEIATVELTLDNTEKLFNLFNNSSTYGKYMVKDLEVEIYTGWRIKKPSNDYLNSSVLTTALQANISNSSSTFSVLDKAALPSGGAGNSFTVVIDEGTQSEEVILCSSVDSSNVVTVLERGYGDTTAKSHSAGATVSFDIYEYVKNGTFYVDEWTVGTDMTVSANLQDWSKFLSERSINYGFFLQNAYVGDAVKNLLMRANFPSADIKKLNTYKQGAKDRGAISLYSFNEQTIDRSGNNIIPSTGLRARFWGMPTNKKNIESVKDILADAIDKELSPMDKALGEKSFVSPSLTVLSKDISSVAGNALHLVNYTFTGNDGVLYKDYFNGVADGYYIPSESGIQQLALWSGFGGVRLYLDDILIINDWQTKTLPRYSVSNEINLEAGVPRKIRVEFYCPQVYYGNSTLVLILHKLIDGEYTEITNEECCTIVPLDAIGSKDALSDWSLEDSFNHRNNGIYINNPKLSQQTGLTSDPTDKSVLLESNSYIRIPYTTMNDLSYKDAWSIEFLENSITEAFLLMVNI